MKLVVLAVHTGLGVAEANSRSMSSKLKISNASRTKFATFCSLALNVDRKDGVNNEDIRNFTNKKGWPFKVLWDKEWDFMDDLEIKTAPLIMILDKKGRVYRSYLTYNISIDFIYGIIYNVDKKKQYYNEAWEYTTSDNASYYRIIETSYDNLESPYSIKDYYLDGTLQMDDGSKYIGQFAHCSRHGKGEYTFALGSKYQGEFMNGKRHGHGVFTFSSGLTYEGTYQDGKRNGEGVFTFPNGETKNVYYIVGEMQ